MQKFIALFNFVAQNAFMIGIERECHLTDLGGQIVPWAPKVLPWLWSRFSGRQQCYGYELSACQLEDRFAAPVPLSRVKEQLLLNEAEIKEAEEQLGFRRMFRGVAPEDMPLDVYPNERYLRLTQTMPREVLAAACRVAGIHIHIGMPDAKTALRVYNSVIKHLKLLYRAGCTYTGDRLGLYRQVVHSNMPKSERIRLFEQHLVTAPEPPPYDSWEQFYERAKREGFDQDPRRLWDFIRISKHGTIEFRVMDTTDDLDLIEDWARLCYDLCRTSLCLHDPRYLVCKMDLAGYREYLCATNPSPHLVWPDGGNGG